MSKLIAKTCHIYSFGDYALDLERGGLMLDGREVKLRPKVYEALKYLVENNSRLVSKAELIQAVWPDSFVTDDSLVQCLVEVRRALGDEAQQLIKTVPRRGYIFAAEVKEINPSAINSVYAEQIEAIQNVVDVDPDPAAGKFHSNDDKAIDSLIVLPLTNGSSDPTLDYLSDGITESIISNLSQLPKLRVMAWSTISRFKSSHSDPVEVGRRLRVHAVLTGRLLHVRDRLVIKAELVDAMDGSQIWGGHYDREMSDIFAIEREISSQISEKLRLKLTGEERRRLAKPHTENTEAYHAYLKGRYYWNKRSEEGLRKGLEFFKQAIEQDPGYALAYDGLADSYNVLGFYSILPPGEAFPKAKSAAMKALKLDDELAEAHASLGYAVFYYDWDWLAAESEFQRAIELNPNYAMAHQFYDNLLTSLGRWEEALTELKRARELDPLSLIMNAGLGWVCYFAREYDQAIDYLSKALEWDSNFELAHMWLGWVYEQKSMFAEAIAEFEKAAALSGSRTGILAALGHAYALSGKRAEAQMMLDHLAEVSRQKYVSPYRVASIHAALGQKEQALAWLERAYQDRSHLLVFLKVDPKLDNLRQSPRFEALLRRVGLRPARS